MIHNPEQFILSLFGAGSTLSRKNVFRNFKINPELNLFHGFLNTTCLTIVNKSFQMKNKDRRELLKTLNSCCVNLLLGLGADEPIQLFIGKVLCESIRHAL